MPSPQNPQPKPDKVAAVTPVRPPFPLWLMTLLLALGTVALYWPAVHHDFVNFDDDAYVTANVHVQAGLTIENLRWALITPVDANWHPLTVLSHMLDCQLYGLKPWGHHLTSVLLHAFDTALVFLFLRRATGAFWRSFWVAAFFGWHPLHVESVGWVAERKDVLSTFFGLLTLLFYLRYARGRGAGQPLPVTSYLLALFCFALGLMSKPMLVTWPFVLLLLDCWPLKRISDGCFAVRTWKPLLLEKIPFFALAAAAAVMTCLVQKGTGTMYMGEKFPLHARCANALISYCRYLGKIVWPTNLELPYPLPAHWPAIEVLLAGALLTGLTILFFVQRRRYPYVLMGWLWFLGTLVPVIGLVQVGVQAMADRYAYIPSLGIFIAIIWSVSELARLRYPIILAGSVALMGCIALTHQQLGYWQDSETLFRHAALVDKDNSIAHNNLAEILEQKGRLNEAIPEYQEVVRLNPGNAAVINNLGNALLEGGQLDDAVTQYREALRLQPDLAEAHNQLGEALDEKGQTDAAIPEYQQALRLRPDYPEAHNNLGLAYQKKGQLPEAIQEYQQVVRLAPDVAEVHNNLANALLSGRRRDEAITEYQAALRLKPDLVEAQKNLAYAQSLTNTPAGK